VPNGVDLRPSSVRPELVEGLCNEWLVVRQAHHERLREQHCPLRQRQWDLSVHQGIGNLFVVGLTFAKRLPYTKFDGIAKSQIYRGAAHFCSFDRSGLVRKKTHCALDVGPFV